MKIQITSNLKTILFASSNTDTISLEIADFFRNNINATIIDSQFSSNNTYFSVFIYYTD